MLIAVQWISIATAIKPDLNAGLLFPCIVGVTFLVIGNFMPTISRNRTVGFRTLWSIKSDLSWKKTNRLGGYVTSIFGLVLIAGGIFESTMLIIIAAFGFILAVLILVYLSYAYWKKDPDRV